MRLFLFPRPPPHHSRAHSKQKGEGVSLRLTHYKFDARLDQAVINRAELLAAFIRGIGVAGTPEVRLILSQVGVVLLLFSSLFLFGPPGHRQRAQVRGPPNMGPKPTAQVGRGEGKDLLPFYASPAPPPAQGRPAVGHASQPRRVAGHGNAKINLGETIFFALASHGMSSNTVVQCPPPLASSYNVRMQHLRQRRAVIDWIPTDAMEEEPQWIGEDETDPSAIAQHWGVWSCPGPLTAADLVCLEVEGELWEGQ